MCICMYNINAGLNREGFGMSPQTQLTRILDFGPTCIHMMVQSLIAQACGSFFSCPLLPICTDSCSKSLHPDILPNHFISWGSFISLSTALSLSSWPHQSYRLQPRQSLGTVNAAITGLKLTYPEVIAAAKCDHSGSCWVIQQAFKRQKKGSVIPITQFPQSLMFLKVISLLQGGKNLP